ncbi:MAG: hypothetical protein JWQ62_1666 [Lacunisphaera sp.]|jgi:hypothetical protein|nr:hypothetical protein [Lacunisphaera sp.]
MEQAALILLVVSLIGIGWIVFKALLDPPRGAGGHIQPPLREKPSADEPTPARSATASAPEARAAQRHTPPA